MWTKDRPISPGYYWWRANRFKESCLFCVFYRGGQLEYRHSQQSPSDPWPLPAHGEWFGPLTAPE